MAEATHTSEALFSLGPGRGKGAKIWAGVIQVSDGETIATGLSKIEGMAAPFATDADIDADTPVVRYSSVALGVVTFVTGKLGAYANLTDTDCYWIVAGWAK